MARRRPRSFSPIGIDSSVQQDKNTALIALNGITSTVEEKNSDYLCPVCFDVIREAHITRCGHTFCYQCIFKSINRYKRCPTCSAPMIDTDSLFPNYVLDELIAKHILKVPISVDAHALGVENVNSLKHFVSAETQKLSLSDINIILDILTQRKQLLEVESCEAQNKLLHEFLRHLLKQKEEQQVQIAKEIILVRKDLEKVEHILKTAEAETGKMFSLYEGSSKDKAEKTQNTSIDVSSKSNFEGSSEISVDGKSSFLTRKRRMYSHFDDFAETYFATRDRDLYMGRQQFTTETNPVERNKIDSENLSRPGLDFFRDSLVKFSRYSTFRPLATMHYSSDIHVSSTIVSTIVFDKDNEYFAIGGVTKRIKVYDYFAVVRDTVDIHYPCLEMVSNSKISCIAWNSSHKNVLASSDYEGSVNIWDVVSGLKTRSFHEHERRCWSVDFNEKDAKLVVSGSDDARVKLWSLQDDSSIATLEAKANVCCVKFNPKSAFHLAFGSADHDVHYYDLRNLNKAVCVFKGHKKAVSYVKFLDTQEIVSASTDSQLKLWNVNCPPNCLRSFSGHYNEKNFVGLATDGDYIACGSEDNSLFLYYKGLSKPLFNYKIDVNPRVSDLERSNDVNEFVSAVCWRERCNILLAANSRGLIKVLELV